MNDVKACKMLNSRLTLVDMASLNVLYNEKTIRFLESLWGEGYMSPGGQEEVDKITSKLSFKGKDILDIGCGAGGATIYLAEHYSPRTITGYDIEKPAIELAKRRTQNNPSLLHLAFVLGQAGTLPFDEASFDIAFSKEVMVHIPDKATFFADVYRLLKPGGKFAASDWLISHDGTPSAEMQAYFAINGLAFSMRSIKHYVAAMEAAGFTDIKTVDRNRWARSFAHDELKRMKGTDYAKLSTEFGADYLNKKIDILKAKIKVLDSGEHCPTHLFATKPCL